MKQKSNLGLILQICIVASSAALFLLVVSNTTSTALAFPEYGHYTSETCATCHVNPGGGGPRTLRGGLWAARGRPAIVPLLPGVLLAPKVTAGADLYEIACATCHGSRGEGLFGREIANTGLNAAKIRTNILRGRLKSGMPAFEGLFTDSQLQALIDYTLALAKGDAEIPPQAYPLDPAQFGPLLQPVSDSYGGN